MASPLIHRWWKLGRKECCLAQALNPKTGRAISSLTSLCRSTSTDTPVGREGTCKTQHNRTFHRPTRIALILWTFVVNTRTTLTCYNLPGLNNSNWLYLYDWDYNVHTVSKSGVIIFIDWMLTYIACTISVTQSAKSVTGATLSDNKRGLTVACSFYCDKTAKNRWPKMSTVSSLVPRVYKQHCVSEVKERIQSFPPTISFHISYPFV